MYFSKPCTVLVSLAFSVLVNAVCAISPCVEGTANRRLADLCNRRGQDYNDYGPPWGNTITVTDLMCNGTSTPQALAAHPGHYFCFYEGNADEVHGISSSLPDFDVPVRAPVKACVTNYNGPPFSGSPWSCYSGTKKASPK